MSWPFVFLLTQIHSILHTTSLFKPSITLGLFDQISKKKIKKKKVFFKRVVWVKSDLYLTIKLSWNTFGEQLVFDQTFFLEFKIIIIIIIFACCRGIHLNLFWVWTALVAMLLLWWSNSWSEISFNFKIIISDKWLIINFNYMFFFRQGGTMVTYGGMSKEPVTISTSNFIFKVSLISCEKRLGNVANCILLLFL